MSSATFGVQEIVFVRYLDRPAAAAEPVVLRGERRAPPARLAERHREGVDEVLAGGGGAPGVVAPAAEKDVEVDAEEGRAAGVDPGRVDLLLHQDLGSEVGDLGTEDRRRAAAARLARRDEQGVGGAWRAADPPVEAVQSPRAARPPPSAVRWRRRRSGGRPPPPGSASPGRAAQRPSACAPAACRGSGRGGRSSAPPGRRCCGSRSRPCARPGFRSASVPPAAPQPRSARCHRPCRRCRRRGRRWRSRRSPSSPRARAAGRSPRTRPASSRGRGGPRRCTALMPAT